MSVRSSALGAGSVSVVGIALGTMLPFVIVVNEDVGPTADLALAALAPYHVLLSVVVVAVPAIAVPYFADSSVRGGHRGITWRALPLRVVAVASAAGFVAWLYGTTLQRRLVDDMSTSPSDLRDYDSLLLLGSVAVPAAAIAWLANAATLASQRPISVAVGQAVSNAIALGVVLVGYGALGPVSVGCGLVTGHLVNAALVAPLALRRASVVGPPDAKADRAAAAAGAFGFVFVATLIAKLTPLADRGMGLADGAGAATLITISLAVTNLSATLLSRAPMSAYFGSISHELASGRLVRAQVLGAEGVRLLAWIAAPVAAILLVLPESAVELFDWVSGGAVGNDADELALLLRVHAPAVIVLAVGSLVTGLFYARSESKLPATVSVCGAVVYALIAALLFGPFGVTGAAIAFTVMSSANLAFLIAVDRRRGDRGLLWNWRTRDLLGPFAVAVAAALVVRLMPIDDIDSAASTVRAAAQLLAAIAIYMGTMALRALRPVGAHVGRD